MFLLTIDNYDKKGDNHNPWSQECPTLAQARVEAKTWKVGLSPRGMYRENREGKRLTFKRVIRIWKLLEE